MGQKYALIIGNTEYLDPSLAQLASPSKDVADFAEVLSDQQICGFNDVKILLNESELVISEAIDVFFDQRKSNDLLVLYFSGHGIRDEFGALYLGVKNTNRSRLRSTAVKSDYIRESMDQSRSRRQILILDCCNSGAFSQGTKAVTGGSIGTASAFEGTGYGRVVLTASDSTQFAWEGNKFIGEAPNSLFTHFLIKGLKGEADRNRDGNITVDELYDYTYEQILNITPKQTPGKWSYKEQGEIILRHDIPIGDNGTRTGDLRRELLEQAKLFKNKQEGLLQEKAELEAKVKVASRPTINNQPKSTNIKMLLAWISVTTVAVCVVSLAGILIGMKILPQIFPSATTPLPQVQTQETKTPEQIAQPTSIQIATQPTLNLNNPFDLLINPSVLFTDTFDNSTEDNWNISLGSITNSALEISGNKDWHGTSYNGFLLEGQAIAIDFNYSSNSLFGVYVDSGAFDKDSYKRYGVYVGENQAEINEYKGTNEIGGEISGDLSLHPDTTYSLLIVILPNGEFLEGIWDPSDPSKTLQIRQTIDPSWTGSSWTFWIGVNTGTIKFDNFQVIEFSGVK